MPNPFRVVHVLAFVTMAILYLAIPNAPPDFIRFNVRDSQPHLALAHSLAMAAGTHVTSSRIYLYHNNPAAGSSSPNPDFSTKVSLKG